MFSFNSNPEITVKKFQLYSLFYLSLQDFILGYLVAVISSLLAGVNHHPQ